MTKLKNSFKLLISLLVVSGILFFSNNAKAVSTISISSPANGQEYSGNSFAISGTTDQNTTVYVKKGTTVLKQVKADGSGNWSANLTNLPDGPNTITATAVKATGYAYFTTTPDGFGTVKLNQLQLSNNAINPSAPFPLTPTNKYVAFIPSPSSSIFYGFSSILSPSTIPGKFDESVPADPVTIQNGIDGAYPANPGANLPAFTLDGSKIYFPNMNRTDVSVVDVATNSFIKNIDLGESLNTIHRATNGKIYVTTYDDNDNSTGLSIIDPANDNVSNISTTCAAANLIFSEDIAYPYYFAACPDAGLGKIVRYKVSDNSVDVTWNVGYQPTGGYINPENSKLYVYNGALGGAADSNKILVVNTLDGIVAKTITLTGGTAGFAPSPDSQKLYVGIPNNDLSGNSIDIVNLQTEEVTETLTTLETPIAPFQSKYSTQDTAIKNVSVVLGVKTSVSGGGSLANTGAIAVSATILIGIILGSSSYIYYDYRKHKKPLIQDDPTVRYTLSHHMKVVTLPLVRYRLQFTFSKPENGPVKRF